MQAEIFLSNNILKKGMENFDLPNLDSSLLCLLWSIVFGDRTAHRLTGGVPAGGLGSI